MSCFPSAEEKENKLRNKIINDTLKTERKQLKQEIKLLLLGAGESGKSTIVKQMRIIHGTGYSGEERTQFKPIVYKNIVTNMQVLLEGAEDFGFKLSDLNKENSLAVWNYDDACSQLFPTEVLPAIEELLDDPAIQQALDLRNKLQLNDSAEYYFAGLDRIGRMDYVPDEQDILRSRVATTGIIEFKFCMHGKTQFRMIDVGGQRSERRKWIHCFEDVTSITFIASLAGYDQLCIEDGKTNRMQESLALWEQIVNYPIFKSASLILFLNKVDLLRKKIKTSHVRDYFPDFQGPTGDARAAGEFMLDMYHERVDAFETEDKTMYPHFTTATDTENVQKVIESVRDTILQHNLRAYAIV